MIHEKSSTYGGPVVSSTSRSAGGRGKSQNIMISRHQLVRPKEHHLRGQKDGSKSEKILASRHQLRRPNSEIKLTKSCSVSNLVRTTQNESIMRSSYGSTGQSLKNLRNSSRSFTSASSNMNSNSEVKTTKSSSVYNLVRKTQNESMRRSSSYGSTGQSLKNRRNSSRSFTSASSSMTTNNGVKMTKSISGSILVRKTQNESMRSSYGSAGQILKRSFTSASSSMKRNVSFDKVSIREYPRCVGDNPSVTTGPPIS